MSENAVQLAMIGGEPALVRITNEGHVRSIRQKVPLNAGEHWFTSMVYNPELDRVEPKKVLTAKAYDMLRSLLGIYVSSPDTFVDEEGKVVGNPCITRNGGMIDVVRYRVVAFGRGAAGNWSMVDLTFLYSVTAYLGEELYNRWVNLRDDRPPEPREWGRLVPDEEETKGKLKVPIAMAGMSLAVDINHHEVLPIWKEYQESQKFAERNAHTMAVRNALRKLTGISYADDDNTVTVTIWPKVDKDSDQIAAIISAGSKGSTVIDGSVVKPETVVVTATKEDAKASVDEDQTAVGVKKSIAPPNTDAVNAEIRKKLQSLGPRSPKVQTLVKSLGFKNLTELKEKASLEQLVTFDNSLSVL